MNRKYLAEAACLLLALGFVSSCSNGNDDVATPTSVSSSSSATTVPTTKRPPVATDGNETTVPPPQVTTRTQPTSPAPGVTNSPPGCPDNGWTTLDDSGTQLMTIGGVYDVRPVAAQCHDTVFFDVNTTEDVGFFVYYTDNGDGSRDGSGAPVEAEGAAALQVVIFAPAANVDLFNGYSFNPDPNWSALREVTFAGSFEGNTSFVIGVGSKTPFAVEREHANGRTQIVVRIAH
jgi:hypothetical protein